MRLSLDILPGGIRTNEGGRLRLRREPRQNMREPSSIHGAATWCAMTSRATSGRAELCA